MPFLPTRWESQSHHQYPGLSCLSIQNLSATVFLYGIGLSSSTYCILSSYPITQVYLLCGGLRQCLLQLFQNLRVEEEDAVVVLSRKEVSNAVETDEEELVTDFLEQGTATWKKRKICIFHAGIVCYITKGIEMNLMKFVIREVIDQPFLEDYIFPCSHPCAPLVLIWEGSEVIPNSGECRRNLKDYNLVLMLEINLFNRDAIYFIDWYWSMLSSSLYQSKRTAVLYRLFSLFRFYYGQDVIALHPCAHITMPNSAQSVFHPHQSVVESREYGLGASLKVCGGREGKRGERIAAGLGMTKYVLLYVADGLLQAGVSVLRREKVSHYSVFLAEFGNKVLLNHKDGQIFYLPFHQSIHNNNPFLPLNTTSPIYIVAFHLPISLSINPRPRPSFPPPSGLRSFKSAECQRWGSGDRQQPKKVGKPFTVDSQGGVMQ